jgi:cyclophilin family peptidyl-prolyl cis-trans isomerase
MQAGRGGWWAVAAIALLCLLAAAPASANPVVRFTTNLGTFDVELFQSQVPTTVDNFLSYVNAGSYTSSIIHRSTTYTTGIQIVQGGGFFLNETTTPPSLNTIATGAPIALDAILPNLQGTIAMARTNDPDSATSGWYFNVTDNPQLDATPGVPGTGYTVFGRIIPGDLGVLDAIAGVEVFDASAELGPAFSELPLLNPALEPQNLVMVNSIVAVPEPGTLALALTAMLFASGFRKYWQTEA